MVIRIEDCFKRSFLWNHNRSGRQPGIHVGIVRGIYLKVTVQNPVHLESEKISHRRVSLKSHSYPEAIEINSGDLRHLRFMVGLPGDYGSQNGDLFLGEAKFLGLGDICRCLEIVICLFETSQYLFHGFRPIDFICVRDYHGEHVLDIEPEFSQKFRIT